MHLNCVSSFASAFCKFSTMSLAYKTWGLHNFSVSITHKKPPKKKHVSLSRIFSSHQQFITIVFYYSHNGNPTPPDPLPGSSRQSTIHQHHRVLLLQYYAALDQTALPSKTRDSNNILFSFIRERLWSVHRITRDCEKLARFNKLGDSCLVLFGLRGSPNAR